jgi:hypothetical protein
MEGLVLLSHKNMWSHDIRFRVHALKEQGKTVLIMGPSKKEEVLKSTVERWAKAIEADGVAWIDDLVPEELANSVRDLMIERSEVQVVLISENVVHQAVADLIGAEFVRAHDWN